MNEYKNMHFSLHHTRVVGASKWSGSVLYLVCVCVWGGGGGRGVSFAIGAPKYLMLGSQNQGCRKSGRGPACDRPA